MALRLGNQNRSVNPSTSYLIGQYDDVVSMNAASGALTATLPDSSLCAGHSIWVVKSDSSANTVTIVPLVSTQTIGGFSSRTIKWTGGSTISALALRNDGLNPYGGIFEAIRVK